MFAGVSTEFLLVSIVSLFTIVNPLGATPFFLAHTSNLGKKERNSIARRASVACFLVLVFFALAGKVLFELMGITIPAFRIAGGILVGMSALDMVKGANVRSRTLPEEQEEALAKSDISIIPLAIPLLSGPGAISTVMVLMARGRSWNQDAVILGIVFLVSVSTYLILVHSSYLLRIIGPSGVRVMNRLMGLMLAAISVQFVINGLKDIVPELVGSIHRGR
ncbi:MAG TPA: MarC family protein [Bdellovibrionota bacterium]|nr:MarC family protein [Bdellovibrionota bacterium]